MKIKKAKLKNRLEGALSKRMHTGVHIKKIKDVQVIEAPSRNFHIARLTISFRKESSDKNERLNLILKRLKSNPPKTDFSGVSDDREVDKLPAYTRRLFEYLQGPINNGREGGNLVRFYGQEGNELYEEDAGDISMERLFIEKTPNTKLLEDLIQTIAIAHFRWAENINPYMNELYDLRLKKEENFLNKLHDNLDVILEYFGKHLKNSEKDILSKLFLGIDEYFKDPDFSIFTRIIHSDLHLGHIFLRYNDKKFSSIKNMSKNELSKYNPEIKIIDLSAMRIGPQTFDLVDILKHPAAINCNEYPTQNSQRGLIEDLLRKYIIKKSESWLEVHHTEPRNGIEIKSDLEFHPLFYVSNIYRDIRAAANGISVIANPKNKGLYEIYKKLNPKYHIYPRWYLADLGETLRYLMSDKFENSFKNYINHELLEQSFSILKGHLHELEEDPILISKEIVNY